MKLKKNGLFLIIFILIVLLAVMSFYLFSSIESSSDNSENYGIENQNRNSSGSSSKNVNTKKITSTSEVKSALTEKIELHATYYLEEVYVEKNSYVAKGEKILKYTNGTYLNAPYDCYIVELKVPEESGRCLNSHYVQIQSKNILAVSIKIDETNINKVKVGDEVQINLSAIDKTYTGYITHISSTANNGKFTINIEFENDGNVKIGMTSTVQISI